ncbi:hypothetical protein BDF20DRAFT_932323 [Mycotypha africana]|uniref:uncharacterized protein n=1 Tax=Mycotypha africana TaxID=64632 RepID=UPI002301A85F|nr:uncharacterized protein BDF20DRAFT_932323 [Mycotypha africana]KAI8988441.1 hypothetical protein BDF20DRAFT_932323 [Mycotypha africana]
MVVLMKQKKFVNLNRALYSRLGRVSKDEFAMAKILSHVVETYVHYEKYLLPEVFNNLVEASVIIKFWSTAIEALFSVTNLVVNWGDTISYGPVKTNRKMDLRIL